MEPLKITIHLATEFVKSAYPIHLDSIIGNLYVKHYLPDEDKHDEISLFEILDELPIEKYEKDGDWIYKASALLTNDHVKHSSRFITRRYPESDVAIATIDGTISNGNYKQGKELQRHAMKIDTKRGHQKNILSYYPTTQCKELVCFCVGDKDLIEEALIEWGHISHIGAQRRMGHGLIKDIQVSICEEANEKWKLRASPWELIADSVLLKCNTKNPYWDKKAMINAFCPNELF